MPFGDDRADAVRRQADTLIASLDLTAEEEAFARTHAEIIFEHVTRAYLGLPDAELDRTRAVSAAAAVAFALVTTIGWADRTDADFPPG